MGLSCQKCLFALMFIFAVGCSKPKSGTKIPDAPLDQYLRIESSIQKRYNCIDPGSCRFKVDQMAAMKADVDVLLKRGEALRKGPQPADPHLDIQRKVAFERLEAWAELAHELDEEIAEQTAKAKPKTGATEKPQVATPAPPPAAPKPTVSPHFAEQRTKLEEQLKDLGCESEGRGVNCTYAISGTTLNDLKNTLRIRALYRTYATLRSDEEKAHKAIGSKAPAEGAYQTVEGQLKEIDRRVASVWNYAVLRSYKVVNFENGRHAFPAGATDEEILAKAAQAKAEFDRIEALHLKVRSEYWNREYADILITENETKAYDKSALNYAKDSPKGPHLRVAKNITEQELIDLLKSLPTHSSDEGKEYTAKKAKVNNLRDQFPIVSSNGARVESRVEAPYSTQNDSWKDMTLDEQAKVLASFVALAKGIEESAQAKNYTGKGRISVLVYGKERETDGALVLVLDKKAQSAEDLLKQIDVWLSKNSRK